MISFLSLNLLWKIFVLFLIASPINHAGEIKFQKPVKKNKMNY